MKTESPPLPITVCTPTYNRGAYLNRVFESLCMQDFNGFEWVIVDDGSTDDTDVVVNNIIATARFPVVFLKQPNSGKHIAVNKALDIARGELFLILDSDDRCHHGALMTFYREWQQISVRKDEVAGITVLTMYESGDIIGSRFPHARCIEYLPRYYERYTISGDKWDIHQTAIFKRYKFPETPGEKFCAEGLIWNRISSQYKMLFLNQALKVVEYLPDGLSRNAVKTRAGSPVNAMMYYEEVLQSDRSIVARLRAAVNYFRFAFHGGKCTLALCAHPFWGVFVIAASTIFWRVDRRRLG
jgi:glycosyltransferase involved in cell wall biosynthesis